MSPETTVPSFGQLIYRLAQVLGGSELPTGDRAALRRMDPREPGRAALPLHRLLFAAGVEGAASAGNANRWALLVHCLAIARGRHDRAAPTGKALCDLGLTEARLNQLLAADEEVLFDLLPRIARRLAAQNAAVDWLPLARILLAGADAADQARLDIARSYARTQAA